MQTRNSNRLIVACALVALFCASGSTLTHAQINVGASRANHNAVQLGHEYSSFIVYFNSESSKSRSSVDLASELSQVEAAIGVQLTHDRTIATGGELIRTETVLSAADAHELLDAFEQSDNLVYVEPDAILQPDFVPSDARYSEQWNLFEFPGGINAPAAWDWVTGIGVTVAVLDSGITQHPDLNTIGGYDFIRLPIEIEPNPIFPRDNNGRDADPSDEGTWEVAEQCGNDEDDTFRPTSESSWHGTGVAGVIGAETDNGIGVAGVAFDADIVPVRVLGACGGRLSDVSEAVIWAAGGNVHGIPANPNPADVLNLSLGIPGDCGTTMRTAIDTALSLGAVVVVSAGNSSVDAATQTPANCPGAITVAATNRAGEAAGTNHGSVVDIAAPGSGILTTSNTGETTPAQSTFDPETGTSFAAPQVAGVIALMLEADPSLSRSEIMSLLASNARPLQAPCPEGCGAGIVDAGATIAAILELGDKDAFEEDDVPVDFTPLANGQPQEHNFADDTIDWAGTWFPPSTVTVTTSNLGIDADTCISVFRPNDDATDTSGPPIATDCDSGPGEASSVTFNTSVEAGFFFRVTNENGGLLSSDSGYTLLLERTSSD